MSPIDYFLFNSIVRSIISKINTLPPEAKYRASSALRALNWASRIYNLHVSDDRLDIHIPATQSALHATEEAVAALIITAKKSNYGKDANISIVSHFSKATVSFLAQKMQNEFSKHNLSIGYDKNKDTTIIRFKENGKFKYSSLSLSMFNYNASGEQTANTEFLNDLTNDFKNTNELLAEITRVEKARIKTYYASDTGYPTGFDTPLEAILRECQLTIGLIWATIDIHLNREEKIKIVELFFSTAKAIILLNEQKKGGRTKPSQKK